jgi:hypothetical protein
MLVTYIQMDKLIVRILLFMIGCMGVRSLFVYVSKNISVEYLPLLGYLALLPAIGFTYIYLTNSRTTGPEVFGDVIWWNYLRPVHALLYTLFACYAISGNKSAWVWLLIDLIVGLVGFLNYHWGGGT